MAESLLLDTGPLVAILNKSDSEHARCAGILAELRHPLITCWPVVTEAVHLIYRGIKLRGQRPTAERLEPFWKLTHEGAIEIVSLASPNRTWFESFYRQYHDQKLDIADVALVYLADSQDLQTVFSFDSDFDKYVRPSGGPLRRFPL